MPRYFNRSIADEKGTYMSISIGPGKTVDLPIVQGVVKIDPTLLQHVALNADWEPWRGQVQGISDAQLEVLTSAKALEAHRKGQ